MKRITRMGGTALLSCLALLPAMATASPLEAGISDLQHQWAHINYQLPETKREAAFTTLEQKAAALAARYPNRAEPKLWQAIILSTHAGVHGGLGALSMVDKARDLLLAAEKIDPNAMHGSIYTSLGSLYYQVPGWPLGFGDDDKAKGYLLKALKLNPNGIDPNYFYGDFLYRNDERKAALIALDKALKAPPRPDRPVADRGRRKEIRELITKIKNG
jgi:tetratricopeptide (TPR) repeat protein